MDYDKIIEEGSRDDLIGCIIHLRCLLDEAKENEHKPLMYPDDGGLKEHIPAPFILVLGRKVTWGTGTSCFIVCDVYKDKLWVKNVFGGYDTFTFLEDGKIILDGLRYVD